MEFNTDRVIAGDFKNGKIRLKGFSADKVVIIHKTLLGKSVIKLDKTTVESINIQRQSNDHFGSTYQVEIIFKNGKKSLALLSELMYAKLSAAIF